MQKKTLDESKSASKYDYNTREVENLASGYAIMLAEIINHFDEKEGYIGYLEEKLARKSPIRFFLKKIYSKSLKFLYEISKKLKLVYSFKNLIKRYPKLQSYLNKKLKS